MKSVATFGLAKRAWKAQDVWESKAAATIHSVDQTIAPHGCVLLILR